MSRWVFTDTVLSTTYTFPVNPDSMASLSPSHSRRSLAAGITDGRIRVIQDDKRNSAFEWGFSGKISTQAHYDAFLAWRAKPYPITVTIHNGRVYKILLREFKPVDKRSRNTTRWTYTMDATVIERIS